MVDYCSHLSDVVRSRPTKFRVLDVRLSLSVALSTIQMTVRFGTIQRTPWRWSGASHLSFFYTNLSREDLRLDGFLNYTYAAQALYIYKHPCLLRDSNPGPTAQQSASLTTILDGRPVEYCKYLSTILF
ncbi:hypothetical protein TNCV_1974861 [Trichonephila clavipes]|nr:hypothetical protein TNCV_1974861 [Trichonephila clavipes]